MLKKGHQAEALQNLLDLLDPLLDMLADKIAERQKQADRGKAQPGGDGLLKAKEAAELLGLSPSWLYKNSRRLPFAVKVGGALRFEKRAMERWLEARRK